VRTDEVAIGIRPPYHVMCFTSPMRTRPARVSARITAQASRESTDLRFNFAASLIAISFLVFAQPLPPANKKPTHVAVSGFGIKND
jgi:hypothetical protein